jgi:hypothetical protein
MPLGFKMQTRLTRRRGGRKVLAPRVRASVKCGICHKRMANPLTHVCTIKSDFRKRAADHARRQKQEKAAARRRERDAARRERRAEVRRQVAARKRERAKAARAAKARPAARPARPAHPAPAACRDRDCQRQACAGYRDGYSDGFSDGASAAGS